MKDIQKNSCIRFERKGRLNKFNYVEISTGTGSSDLGYYCDGEKHTVFVGEQIQVTPPFYHKFKCQNEKLFLKAMTLVRTVEPSTMRFSTFLDLTMNIQDQIGTNTSKYFGKMFVKV
jgi:hypothetical protein